MVTRRFTSVFRLLILAGLLFRLGGCAGTLDPGPVARETFLGNHAADIPSGTTPDSLLVVSYNIAFARNVQQAAAQLQADPRLQQADILLLQEMDPEGTEYLARELGMNFVYGPAYKHRRHGRRWGCAVLSRWPIQGHSSVVLPHPNPFSNNHRRAVAADITIGGRTLRAVSVHLSTVVIALEDRLEQVRVLADSLGGAEGPVVIGGDFNSGSAEEIRKMRQTMRHEGFRQVRLPAGKTALGGALDFLKHELVLDHFFFRGLRAGASGIQPEINVSDHLPIWAVFRWGD